MKRVFIFLFGGFLGLIAVPAGANWSLNFGYHNPPGATAGVNFLDFWTNFALELGIGWLDLNSSNRSNSQGNGSAGSNSFAIAGDANVKYLFMAGSEVRPYLQGGLSVATVTSAGDNTGVAAGVGGGFFGGGLFIKGRSVYGYGSYNISGSNSFWQTGLGFMF